MVLETFLLVTPFCIKAPTQCELCTHKLAKCRLNSSPVIPQTLSVTTSNIEILYNGDARAKLSDSLFARYPNLEVLSTSGPNIVSIENSTYASLHKLVCLRIHRTSIIEIPNNLLPEKSLIRQLNLTSNKLTHVPYKLFQNLPLLEELYLDDNNIIISDCTSIGDEFFMLPKLTTLGLARVNVHSACENNISSNFFQPISNTVKVLDLDNTNILQENCPTLLSNLTVLEDLDITLAKSFSSCPAKASELFKNLPQSLQLLSIYRWKTYNSQLSTDQCILKSEHLQGLKNLKNLRTLKMKYNTFIFGLELCKSVFAGFNTLEQLDLGWSQLTVIGENVFEGCPNLKSVSFDGNPIGFSAFTALSSKSSSNLSSLQLTRVGIYSDKAKSFDLSRFFLNVHLEVIDLSYNYMDYIPIFIHEAWKVHPSLQKLHLDRNFLRHLSSSDDDNSTNLGQNCTTFPNLNVFSASKNRLENITGLCDSLIFLNLSANVLTKYWDTNCRVLSSLVNIKVLDLSRNDIRAIPQSLFRKMSQLKELHLEDNYLTAFEPEILKNNPLVEVINLEANVLIEIKLSSFEELDNLRQLVLDHNSITQLDENIIEHLKVSKSIKLFSLQANSLQCTCEQYFIQEFINETDIIPQAASLTCHGPEDLRGKHIYNYERNHFLCDHAPKLQIAGIVLGTIVFAVLFTIPCYRYRWYVKHIRIVFKAIADRISAVHFERKCMYDGYVMYNSESDDDLQFVVEKLKPNIEREEAQVNQEVCQFLQSFST